MASQYLVAVKGLDVEIKGIERAAAAVQITALRAMNRTLDRARTSSARDILDQVAFPKSYLNPSSGRLAVTKRATRADLEGRVTGRFRATSLARFVRDKPRRGQPVNVSVKPGSTQVLPRAFLIPLRSGGGNLDTNANMGLAIRTGGRVLRNSKRAKKLAPGLYLLYGPSVSQAFGQIVGEKAEDAADFFEQEFLRQLDL